MLQADLLGPPTLTVGADILEPPSRRSVALLAYVLVEGRAVPRSELATVLWGEGKLSSLRQALYVLRKLPGADQWLQAGDVVTVRGRTDLHALRRHAAAGDGDAVRSLIRGPFLQGLADVATPAFADWVASVRTEVESAERAALLAEVRRLVERSQPDAAWDALQPALTDAPTGSVLRLAVEVQLARGQHEAALALWEQAAPEGATTGAWQALGERVRRHPAVQRDAEWRRLSDAARRLARVLALDPRPLPPVVVDAAAEVSGHGAAEAWEGLSEVGWLDGEVLRGDVRDRVVARLGPGRAGLHLRLAAALQEAGSDPARVARHLAEAGRTEDAVERLLHSGRRDDLVLARELVTDPAQRLAVLRAGVARLHDEMRHVEVDDWLPELEEHARRLQDGDALLQAQLQRAYQQSLRGELAAAEQTVSRVVLPADDPWGACRVAALRGVIAIRDGRATEVEEILKPSLQHGYPRRRESLLILGLALNQLGRVDRAMALLRRALAEARDAGALATVLRALNGLALVHNARGDGVAAVLTFEEAIEVARAAELTGMVPPLVVNLSRTELDVGRLGSARAHIVTMMGCDEPALARQVWHARGSLEAVCGRFEESSAWLARARQAWGTGRPTLNLTFHICRNEWLATGDPAALDAMREVVRRLRDIPGSGVVCPLLLALSVPDPHEVDRWIPEALPAGTQPVVQMARQRAHLLAGTGIIEPWDETLEHVGRPYQLALVAATVGGDEGAALEEQARTTATRMAEGLLSTQREAWLARVEGWLDDPVGSRGP